MLPRTNVNSILIPTQKLRLSCSSKLQLSEDHTSLPSSLRQRCYDAFIVDRSHPSRLQNDVVNELTSMGFHPQEEMLLTCSGYRLDACVLVHGEKVGIEVDGPFHFTGLKPTGQTIKTMIN